MKKTQAHQIKNNINEKQNDSNRRMQALANIAGMDISDEKLTDSINETTQSLEQTIVEQENMLKKQRILAEAFGCDLNEEEIRIKITKEVIESKIEK